jgi:hypothetical protein
MKHNKKEAVSKGQPLSYFRGGNFQKVWSRKSR